MAGPAADIATPTPTATSTATATATATARATATATGTPTLTPTATATTMGTATGTGTTTATATAVPTATSTATPTGTVTATGTATTSPTSSGTATATATATPTATATSTSTSTSTPRADSSSLGNLRLLGSSGTSQPILVVDTRPTNPGQHIQTTGFRPLGPGHVPGRALPILAQHLPAGATTRFLLAGQSFRPAGGAPLALPPDTTAVLLNVTIVQRPGPSGGFVTLFPGDLADDQRPNASTVNPVSPAINPADPQSISANFTIVRLGQRGPNQGTVAVYTTNELDLLLDLVGYYSPSIPSTLGSVRFVEPVRVLDTRPTQGDIHTTGFTPGGQAIGPAPLTANTLTRLGLAGRIFQSGNGGSSPITFPTDSTGILAHVTLSGAAQGGFVTLLPGNAPLAVPDISTVNPSTAIAFNGAVAALATSGPFAGSVALYATLPTDAIVDVLGYFAPSNSQLAGGIGSLADLQLVTPLRVLDSRPTTAQQHIQTIGLQSNGQPIPAGQLSSGTVSRDLLAGGSFPGGSLPADVKGVLLNVTIVQSQPAGGYVTVYPGDVADSQRPNVSTVNPSIAIAASFWASGLAPSGGLNGGTLAVFSQDGPREVIVDLLGFFR